MREKGATQVEKQVGADPARQAQERVVRDGIDRERAKEGGNDQLEGREVAASAWTDPLVDAKSN